MKYWFEFCVVRLRLRLCVSVVFIFDRISACPGGLFAHIAVALFRLTHFCECLAFFSTFVHQFLAYCGCCCCCWPPYKLPKMSNCAMGNVRNNIVCDINGETTILAHLLAFSQDNIFPVQLHSRPAFIWRVCLCVSDCWEWYGWLYSFVVAHVRQHKFPSVSLDKCVNYSIGLLDT